MLNLFKSYYLSGPDGAFLLRAIHAIWDEDFKTASHLLQLPIVKRNSSLSITNSQLGTNIISLYLFDYIIDELNKISN